MILVGLSDAISQDERVQLALANGAEFSIISAGTIALDLIDGLVGLPPFPEHVLRVDLVAPISIPGEPEKWLVFGERCTWTSDLVAIKF